jgi:uncharacterized protein
MTIRTPIFLLFISLFVLIMSGCLNLGGGTKDVTRFFLLHSLSQQKQQGINIDNIKQSSLGIGPVSIPKLLDRRQIVTRVNDSEIQIANFSRWAEPLAINITRVLTENLSFQLETDQVVVHPWFDRRPDYQLKIDIFQFDCPFQGNAIFTAKWQLIEVKEKKVIFQKRSTFKEPIDVTEIEAMIPILSRLLENFSIQVATKLASLAE